MSKSNTQNQGKIKASIEDFVGPLLKQLANCPRNVIVREMCKLVEEKKIGLFGEIEKQICLFEEIERQIDYWKENKRDDSELLEKFKKLLEKQGIDLSKVSTKSNEVESNFPQKKTTSEIGEPSNINNQDNASSVKLEELDPQQKNCLHVLGIFPENVKLKKKLLVYWWIGLGLVFLEGNKKTNTTEEEIGEQMFSDLVGKGIFKSVHKRKHNKVIDQCIINPTIHRQLIARYRREGIQIYSVDEHDVRALLNVDQKYLSSKEIKNILDDNNAKILQVVQLGRWSCTSDVYDKIVSEGNNYSKDHIEVNDTDFLRKLGEKVTFFSLRGISGIDGLPESIGKLYNLKILDLRSCHNLERLPQKQPSMLCQSKGKWFKNLTCLDISECYVLEHMPKWICELSNLEVLKGFVAGSGGKKNQFCQLGDLSKLKKLRKLGVRITKPLDPEDASGLKSLDWLSILTVTWSINEHNIDYGKVQTISFPKNLEKLDIRCYPEAEKSLTILPYLNRLYIRGGKLTKLVINDSDWKIKILRLRFLEYLKIDWFELIERFTNLEYVEYEECPNLTSFPRIRGGAWDTKIDGPFPTDDDASFFPKDISRRVELKIINNLEAPLDRNDQTLILELTGGLCSDGPGLDLVAVLDTSASIEADKLEKMKATLLFVINKLSFIDHFAIVIFSTEATMLWPLQKMNEVSKKKLEYLVNSLKANDTNFSGFDKGLQMGLDILKDSNISNQFRVKSIIFVSANPACIPPRFSTDVAVHTFGFGKDHDPVILTYIASKSMGGTFSDVSNTNNLTKAVAVCLAGLLTVAVQELTLTITPIRGASAIKGVTVGAYSRDDNFRTGGITVKFGDLYSREFRKVSVYVLLFHVDEEGSADVLKISYSYKISGIKFESDPVIITANRMKMVSTEKCRAPWEIIAEEARLEEPLEIVQEIALLQWGSLVISQKSMENSNELTELLRAKLQEIFQLVISESDKFKWDAFALSLYISHRTQRTAARGDDIEKSMSFATPVMFQFLKDAEKIEEDLE